MERREAFTFSKELVGRPYTLHYWDLEAEAFLPLDYSSTNDSTQSHTNIPENALLWFPVPDVVTFFKIPSDSMAPTLLPGDYVLVDK